MHIESYPEAEVPIELRAQQVALQDRAWPSDQPSGPGPWHDPALRPESMLLVDRGRVLAALDILSKDITHHGQLNSASGLSAVVTDPEHRGRRHGIRIVEAARRSIESRGTDLGIFTCDRYLQAFYERGGWRFLPGTVLVGGIPESPFPSDRLDKVTMGAFFSRKALDGSGSFIGSRIELYPGEIDRLW